jgi:polysaccharide export outer membrane protein
MKSNQPNLSRAFYLNAFLLICSLMLMQSCISHEKLVNFQDESLDKSIDSQYIQETDKIEIQTDDILNITVSTFDSAAARVFNRPVFAGQNGDFIGQGYLVDEEGIIEFPVIGKITVGGLSTDAAKDTIRERLLIYLRDPVVDVRFLNLHVSVMGDVKQPGIYTFSDEKFTLLEALTLAGDLTDFSDRANIMVIREKDKVREFGRVDLTSSRAFESPYFYLKQNDVVYVPPLEEKQRKINDPYMRTLQLVGPLTGLVGIVVTVLRTN